MIRDKESAGVLKRPIIFIQVEATGQGFMTLIITQIKESFDVRNKERVCLLEVIMKATLLI